MTESETEPTTTGSEQSEQQVPQRVLSIHTDIAMLVAFDPVHLLPRVKEPRTWWYQDPLGIPER
jgi:hypothetical protein